MRKRPLDVELFVLERSIAVFLRNICARLWRRRMLAGEKLGVLRHALSTAIVVGLIVGYSMKLVRPRRAIQFRGRRVRLPNGGVVLRLSTMKNGGHNFQVLVPLP